MQQCRMQFLCLALSFSRMILRFTHVVACISSLFLFMLNSIPLSWCTTFCFSFHLWVFSVSILYKSVMNFHVQVFVWIYALFSYVNIIILFVNILMYLKEIKRKICFFIQIFIISVTFHFFLIIQVLLYLFSLA